MNAVVMLPASSRRAALLVHALPKADRQWLLQSLSAEQRDTLEPLLAELEGLGVVGDPAVLTGLVQSTGESPPKHEALPSFHALDARSLAALARLLAQEPAALTARLLAACADPLQARLLAELEPSYQAAVAQARGQLMASAPALDAAALRAASLALQRELAQASNAPHSLPAPVEAAAAAPESTAPRAALAGRPRAAISFWVRSAVQSMRRAGALVARARLARARRTGVAGRLSRANPQDDSGGFAP